MSRVGILFSANVSRKKMSWCCLRTLVVIHLLIETCYVYFFDIRASFWVTVIWNYHYWWRKNFKICSVCTTIRPISNGNLRNFYDCCMWCGKLSNLEKRFLWHFTSRTMKAPSHCEAAVTFFKSSICWIVLQCTVHRLKWKKSSLKAILQNGMERMNEVNILRKKMCSPFLRLFALFRLS